MVDCKYAFVHLSQMSSTLVLRDPLSCTTIHLNQLCWSRETSKTCMTGGPWGPGLKTSHLSCLDSLKDDWNCVMDVHMLPIRMNQCYDALEFEILVLRPFSWNNRLVYSVYPPVFRIRVALRWINTWMWEIRTISDLVLKKPWSVCIILLS